MTRIFQSGAELGAGSLLEFSSNPGVYTVGSSVKRSGSYAFVGNNNSGIYKEISPIDEFYIRAAFYCTTGNASFELTAYETSVIHAVVACAVGSQTVGVEAKRGSTVVASTIPMFNINTWYLIEAYIKIADANGRIVVKVDGATVIDFTGDTRNAGTTGLANQIKFGASTTGMSFDDIAINSVAGTINNSWCGNGYCLAKLPLDGDSSVQLTGQDGNSVDNYLNVDENPNDGDTTYNESDTVDHVDLYGCDDIALGAGESINAVQVVAIAKLDSAGTGSVIAGGKVGGTESWGSAVSLSNTAYKAAIHVINANPDGGDNTWDEGEFNNLLIGVKVA